MSTYVDCFALVYNIYASQKQSVSSAEHLMQVRSPL